MDNFKKYGFRIQRRKAIKICSFGVSAATMKAFALQLQSHETQSNSPKEFRASRAVVDGFSAASYDLYRNLMSGKVGSNEFKALATSFTILTKHFEEIGFMDYVSLRAAESSIFKRPIDSRFSDKFISNVEKAGLTVDKFFIGNAFAQAQKQWPTIEDIYSKAGIHGLNQYTAVSLHRYAEEIARFGRLRAGASGASTLRLRPVGSSFCAGVAAASVYVATWSVMIEFAVIAVPGASVGLAVGGAALAVAGMYCY